MRIKVTQKHINQARGHECASDQCPIALAVKDATQANFVSAGPSEIYISGATCPTPPNVTAFIRAFDFGLSVQPFSFELEL